jgi:hypothetical protein
VFKVNDNKDKRTAEEFYEWAFDTRAQKVIDLANGVKINMEKFFLSFTTHTPALITHGGKGGLNGSIKGIGFVPKQEYLEDVLQKYIEHIKSYSPDDKEYSNRGLKLLVDELYSPNIRDRIDFSKITTLELAKKHTWDNLQVNKEATYLFYQPPRISFELRGTIEIDNEGIYKKFVNAQHDVYHTPNMDKWDNRPALVFHIKEIYDNSASKKGFGFKLM